MLKEALTLAQQLQHIVVPDALLVSEVTLRLLQGDVHGKVCGPVPTAGQADPVVIYKSHAFRERASVAACF